MATVLQQTLRNLCFKTGWCYGVFWKLKRRSRMVLTWEDGYYEYSRSCAVSNWPSGPTRNCPPGGDVCVENGGNPLDQGASAHEVGYPEGQIGLAVAKMSYCVYSMGEGIIGRVAFTGKHQWVFAGEENNCDESTAGGILSSRGLLEKYPAGWQNQFAAGIKTIAVVAVPQGVVQLGSTEMMVEDLQLVDRIKSVFGTLQNVPGAFLSDFLLEGQGGKSTQSVPVVSSVSPSAAVGRPTTLDPTQFPLRSIKGVNATALRLIASAPRVRPASVKSSLNLPVLQSISEVSEAAKASFQGSQLQQGIDAQGSRPAVSNSGPQTLQTCLTVLQADVPTSNPKTPLPSSETLSCHFRGLNDSQLKNNCLQDHHQLSSMVFGAGVRSGGADVALGLQDGIHPDADCIREQLSVDGRTVVGNVSDFHRNDSFVGAPLVNSVVEQQLELFPSIGRHYSDVGIKTKQQFANQNDSTSLAVGIASNRLLSSDIYNSDVGNDFSNEPVEDDLSAQENLGDVSQTSWNRSAKRLKSDRFNGVGIPATLEDSLCSIAGKNVWDQEGLPKSTSSCVSQSTVGGLDQGKHGCKDFKCSVGTDGKEILTTSGLDDFEKYMESLSKVQNGKWDCPFAIGDELSQALGPAFRKRHGKEFWQEVLLHSSAGQLRESPSEQTVGRTCDVSEHSKAEVFQNWGSDCVKDITNRGMLSLHYLETKSEPLLDAVVGNASSGHHSVSTSGNDSFSCKPATSGLDSGLSVLKSIKEGESKCADFNASHDSITKGYVQAMTECETMADVHNVNQVVDAKGHLSIPMSSDWSLKRILNTWTEEGQSVKSDNTQHSQLKKSEELTKSSRKRAKPGESIRPRPKDRQQIQDRVRELREIVPNGSKCSIDALLEKTIKHMLFLQSVTLHAEKLKKTTELKDGMENGASWALELDGQGCPIHVEDLNQPRQMLVQMICDDRGLFLEIADIIRKLGLTILKGVMESRADKIWARFVVEANRDVQRVEIVYSLMQLLPLNNNSSSSSMTVASQSGPVRS